MDVVKENEFLSQKKLDLIEEKNILNKILGFVTVAKMKNMQEETIVSTLNIEWQNYISSLNKQDLKLFEALEAIGQLLILNQIPFHCEIAEIIKKDLWEIEDFFSSIGGIQGYQQAIKDVLNPPEFTKKVKQAPYIRIDEMTFEHIEAIRCFFASFEQMAEVYAIGGAADRLNLTNGEKTLPAACLKIAGKTLLEYLINDVEAKQWLYFKLTGKSHILPIVMMTSFEKDNQTHIFEILHKHNFFNRPKDSFIIFHQPLVPMVDQQMNWQTIDGKGLFLKPGGHGAIWNLCLKEKVFDKLEKVGVKKLFIRQINNPIACIDFGHLAFLGYGLKKDAKFGFFACERFAGSQEGIDVLLEDKNKGFSLTNIEYCQLENAGIDDKPNAEGFSVYPANTNVLFADVGCLKQITKQHPLPGKILNFKIFNINGELKSLSRLETMMQNMADYITESSPYMKSVFMSLSPRLKTISPVKKQKTSASGYTETPQACFYDFMQNAASVLEACGIVHAPILDLESYYQAPAFIFSYLPSLGPVYEIIKQKLKQGILHKGAYFLLNIAEVDIQNIALKGALCIVAKNPYGVTNGETFSENCGRLRLINCSFNNKGMDFQNSAGFYQESPLFFEKCEIILEGFSEFEAVDVEFKGSFYFKVPDGYKMRVFVSEDGKIEKTLEKLEAPSWIYKYEIKQTGFALTNHSLF